MAHVFVSYVRENQTEVQRLAEALKRAGVEVWLDKSHLRPGERWKTAIRRAIQGGAYFIACFSPEYNQRNRTYMNEELLLAVEELRQRPIDRSWFIPVTLKGGEIPDRPIGPGETLKDIQWVDLETDFDGAIIQLVSVIAPLATTNLPESIVAAARIPKTKFIPDNEYSGAAIAQLPNNRFLTVGPEGFGVVDGISGTIELTVRAPGRELCSKSPIVSEAMLLNKNMRRLEFWTLASKELLNAAELPKFSEESRRPPGRELREQFAFSADGSIVAIATANMVWVANTADHRLLMSVRLPSSYGADRSVIELSFDGAFLAVAHGESTPISVYDVQTAKELAQLSGIAGDDAFGGIARFSQDTRMIVAGGWRPAWMAAWEIPSFKQLWLNDSFHLPRTGPDPDPVGNLRFFGASILAITNGRHELRLWNARSGVPIRFANRGGVLSFPADVSSDGSLLMARRNGKTKDWVIQPFPQGRQVRSLRNTKRR
jgi:hypothetical protein